MGSRERYNTPPNAPWFSGNKTQEELHGLMRRVTDLEAAPGGGGGPVQRGATWVRGGTLAVIASDAPVVYIYCPEACTITGVEVLTAGGVGSCVIDIWVDTYTNFPPTVGDTITASAKPTISSSSKYKDTTLTGWDTSVATDSVIAFKLESCSTFTQVSVSLTLEAV